MADEKGTMDEKEIVPEEMSDGQGQGQDQGQDQAEAGSDLLDEPSEAGSLDEREQAFVGLARGAAKEIDADRLMALAHKGQDWESRVQNEEQEAWNQRGKESAKAAPENKEDDDEPVTKADLKAFREDLEKSSRETASESVHARNLQRYGLIGEKALQIQYMAKGYAQQQRNPNIDAIYDSLAKQWGLTTSPVDDKLREAGQLGKARTIGRGQASSAGRLKPVVAPDREEDPDGHQAWVEKWEGRIRGA